MWTTSTQVTLRLRQPRSLAPWQNTLLPQVMTPSSWTTSTTRRLLKWSSKRNPATRYGALVLVWRGTRRWDHRESALFTTVHSGARRISGPKTSLSLSWRKFVASSVLFHTHTRTGRPVHELSSCRQKPSCEMEKRNNQDSPWQKEQILADFRAEIQKHEFQADSDGRSIQELNEIIESQQSEINHAHAGDEQLRRDQQHLHEQLLEQNRELREANVKISMRWKNEAISRLYIRWIFEEKMGRKIKTPSMNSRPEFRNYRMKLIVWMIREIFKDAESVRSGLSHVPSQPALLSPFRDPGGMLRFSLGMPSRNDKPPDIWDTHGISGNVFANPTASCSSPYPGRGFNPWISNVSEHTSPHEMSESQAPIQDPRCQQGPSARN